MLENQGTTQRLTRTARSQLGLVTREQALAAGLSADAILRRISAGQLTRVGWRVYEVGGQPRSWERRALAACLDLGADALLSHESAAAAWDLVPKRETAIHVTVPYGSHGRRQDQHVVVHRARSLVQNDRTTVGRLPVTAIGRTLVDLSAVLSRDSLAAIVDDVLCRRMTTPARLNGALDRLVGPGHRGSAALRRLLAPWLSGNRVESVAEGAFLRAVESAGLPAPTTQFEVRDDKGASARLDFAWPDRMVAVEVDGFRWHASPHAHASDNARATRLTTLGWMVLRTTPTELAERPETVLAAVRRALCERFGGAQRVESAHRAARGAGPRAPARPL